MKEPKKSECVNFTLSIPHLHGLYDSDDRVNRARDRICIWEQAATQLKASIFNTEILDASIAVDLNHILANLKHDFNHTVKYDKLYSDYKAGIPMNFDAEFKKITAGIVWKEDKLEFSVISRSEKVPANGLMESYLHDFFLIMSLAYPGSCNMSGAKLACTENNTSPLIYNDTHISLSGSYFELVDLDSRKGYWPTTRTIPLEKVIKWFNYHRKHFSQVPSSSMERVIFSLWYISKHSDMDPTIIVWLCNALETFFDTSSGYSRRAIEERSIVLLDANTKQSQEIKTELKKLYDLRNLLVHSGMNITHPMFDERLDSRVGPEFDNWTKAVEYGFRLLLASLQTTIDRGWSTPSFQIKTELSGNLFSDAK